MADLSLPRVPDLQSDIPDPTATDEHRTAPSIMLYGEEAESLLSLTDWFRRIGWHAQKVGQIRELREANLWVVDLTLREPDPCKVIRLLADARQKMPLLIIVHDDQLRTCEVDLPRLCRTWPTQADVQFWPYSDERLQLRIRLLVQARDRVSMARQVYEYGELRLDARTRQVSFSGIAIPLTPSEYRLLTVLVMAEGEAMTKADLIRRLHEQEPSALYDERLIESHVSRLRSKLQAVGMDPIALRTVRGIGYVLDISLLEVVLGRSS